MKEKLLQKRVELEADIIFYDEQKKKAQMKLELLDEMIDELEEDAEDAAEEMATDPVEETPNGLL